MQDYFILRDHEGVIRACTSIHDKPSNFEKLIGLGLDPFVYRLYWQDSNRADVVEFWWGTKYGTIIRVPDKLPTTPIKTRIALPKGKAASPSHYYENSML